MRQGSHESDGWRAGRGGRHGLGLASGPRNGLHANWGNEPNWRIRRGGWSGVGNGSGLAAGLLLLRLAGLLGAAQLLQCAEVAALGGGQAAEDLAGFAPGERGELAFRSRVLPCGPEPESSG